MLTPAAALWHEQEKLAIAPQVNSTCNDTYIVLKFHLTTETSPNKERQDRKQMDYKRGTIEIDCERDREYTAKSKAKRKRTKSTAIRLRNEKVKEDK